MTKIEGAQRWAGDQLEKLHDFLHSIIDSVVVGPQVGDLDEAEEKALDVPSKRYRVGIFQVDIGLQAPISCQAEGKTNCRLNPGDHYIEMHNPPRKDERPYDLKTIRESFETLVEFLEKLKNEKPDIYPKMIIGLTYEQIARLAPRFGFQVEEIELDEHRKKEVARMFYTFSPRYKNHREEIEKFFLVWQTPENLIERFKKTTS